jgi:hypothetical protein
MLEIMRRQFMEGYSNRSDVAPRVAVDTFYKGCLSVRPQASRMRNSDSQEELHKP